VSGEQRIRGSERVGGPARGYSWPPFEPGNTVSLHHGSYAVVALKPRAAEIAAGLRSAMGERFEERFTPAIETAALALARVERSLGFLLELDEETINSTYSRLDQDARGWLRAAWRTLEALGLTPEVARDVATGPVSFVVVSAFREQPSPHADIELEAHEVREIEGGAVAADRDENSPYAKPDGTDEHARDERGEPS
jgi:hypothetical protein